MLPSPDRPADTALPPRPRAGATAATAGAGSSAHRDRHAPARPTGTGASADSVRLARAVRHALASDAAAEADGGPGPSTHLDRLLSSMPVIEQSKGLLMGFYGIDSEAAYEVLRRWSSLTNIRLAQLSEQLVAAAARPGSEPFAGMRTLLDVLRHDLSPVAGSPVAGPSPRA